MSVFKQIPSITWSWGKEVHPKKDLSGGLWEIDTTSSPYIIYYWGFYIVCRWASLPAPPSISLFPTGSWNFIREFKPRCLFPTVPCARCPRNAHCTNATFCRCDPGFTSLSGQAIFNNTSEVCTGKRLTEGRGVIGCGEHLDFPALELALKFFTKVEEKSQETGWSVLMAKEYSVKSLRFGAELSEFQLYYWPVIWVQANCFASQYLNYLIYISGIVIISSHQVPVCLKFFFCKKQFLTLKLI